MYHSITFKKDSAQKNTWDDWKLVPSSRPVFNPPEQKVKTVDIPGRNGIIDLSQSLTGYPLYNNRVGSIEFMVMNDFKPWQDVYSEIMQFLHGQNVKAILEDDPEYYYEGRFTINEWKSDKDWSKIVIDYDAKPYKLAVQSSLEDWLWDPFNFQNGVIQSSIFKMTTYGTNTTTMICDSALFGSAPVSPSFNIYIYSPSGQNQNAVLMAYISLTLNEVKNGSIIKTFNASLSSGTKQLRNIILYSKPNTEYKFSFKLRSYDPYYPISSSAYGRLWINFRKGRL